MGTGTDIRFFFWISVSLGREGSLVKVEFDDEMLVIENIGVVWKRK